MAVTGWDLFREHFSGYENNYVVIGGFACEVLMRNAELNFRATKDIDMIILMEDNLPGFGRVFWDFIKEGGYKCGWKKDPELHFYRFTEPNPGYPTQIELFSRIPDYHLNAESTIIPIHINDELSSLSAIVMNDDFYDLLQEGKITVDGISTVEASYLIPFKMYAWINLLDKKENGEHVNEKDLKKHKLDVFRLLQIVPDNAKVKLRGLCMEAVQRYIDRIGDEEIRLEQIGLGFTKEQAVVRLRDIYGYS